MTKIGIPEIRKKIILFFYNSTTANLLFRGNVHLQHLFFFACLPVGCVRPFCKLGNCRKKIDQRQKCSQLKGSIDGQMLLTQIFFSWSSLLSQLYWVWKICIFFDLLAEIWTHFLLSFSNKKFFIDLCSHCTLPLN